MPFHGDRLHFCRSHCTHQIQIAHGRDASYPPPMVLVRYNRRCSIPVGAPQSPSAFLNLRQRSLIPSALLSLDWCFDISFSAPYCLFCPHSSSRMGAPQSLPQPRLGAPLFHSRLFTSLPVRRCSAWMGCSAA